MGVCGEGDKIRIEVFVKPSALEASIRVNDQWVIDEQLNAVA